MELHDGSVISLAGYAFAGQPGDGRAAVLGVRPEQIEVISPQPGASMLPLTVSVVEPMGADMLVWGDIGTENLSMRVEPGFAPAVGTPIKAHFVPGQASLFDSATGVRL
jgi:multiple sugar transport system ATP-binding protein